MPSLEILEGLIGTACAVTCLYYVRLGALAGPQNSLEGAVPWHSALGEYARRNPFAAVFGALAFGFLASSWSMYIAPRAIALPAPRVVERWHTITKTVSTSDPAQTARIASLQTTISSDAATIASQQTEIARLKHQIGKSSASHTARVYYGRAVPEMTGNETPAAPADTNPNTAAANAGTGVYPPPATNTANPNGTGAAQPDSASTVPH